MKFFKNTYKDLAVVNKMDDISILEQMGALVVALNSDNTVVNVNSNAINILGYKKEEIIGENWLKNLL